MRISGNKLFVKALQEEGVETLFGYPGGYAIDIFDELCKQDTIEVILPRHEQGLIHAADGYARSTGKTGVCLVTSGPGATNLVTGIATANYDSVPLVCFTGQVPRNLIGNDAFQEVDIIGVTRNICKYGVTVRNREDLGRIIKEAFYIAHSGKPGPVIIDLPKDMMLEAGSADYPETVQMRSYKPYESVHVGQLKRALKMLKAARKPLLLAGGGVTIAGAGGELTRFAELSKVPVITTIMGKGSIPTRHPLYVGNLGMHGCYAANMAVCNCDLLFSIGTRFNDRITGELHRFAPNAKIVHIDIDSAAISRNIQVHIPIVADARQALEKMLEYGKECDTEEWLEQIGEWSVEQPITKKQDGRLTPQSVIEKINELFEEAIVVTDVGQQQMWTSQFLEMDERKRLLTSGGLGTMGYGFPAAIGAQIGNPDKTVLSICGDGGVQMNIQELATAVAEELPVILCIFNNASLGMVRQWQQLFYKRRYACTCLNARKSCRENCGTPGFECPPYTPDFVRLAESYGAAGIRVASASETEAAFRKAMENRKTPTVIEFLIDKDELVMPMVKGGNPLNEMILDY